MLTWKRAYDLQQRVGGRLVEVIPPVGKRPRGASSECNEAAHAGDDSARFCSSRCPGRRKPRKKHAKGIA